MVHGNILELLDIPVGGKAFASALQGHVQHFGDLNAGNLPGGPEAAVSRAAHPSLGRGGGNGRVGPVVFAHIRIIDFAFFRLKAPAQNYRELRPGEPAVWVKAAAAAAGHQPQLRQSGDGRIVGMAFVHIGILAGGVLRLLLQKIIQSLGDFRPAHDLAGEELVSLHAGHISLVGAHAQHLAAGLVYAAWGQDAVLGLVCRRGLLRRGGGLRLRGWRLFRRLSSAGFSSFRARLRQKLPIALLWRGGFQALLGQGWQGAEQRQKRCQRRRKQPLATIVSHKNYVPP